MPFVNACTALCLVWSLLLCTSYCLPCVFFFFFFFSLLGQLTEMTHKAVAGYTVSAVAIHSTCTHHTMTKLHGQ